MSFLADVLSFAREIVRDVQAPEVKIDRGGGDTLRAGHFTDPGIDAAPLPGDVAAVEGSSGTGSGQVTGYQDPETKPEAAGGEIRIYSRSAPGVVAAKVWVKKSGEILITNGTGTFTLNPDGTVEANGAVIDLTGNLTTASQISSDTHPHPTPFGPTGPPLPG